MKLIHPSPPDHALSRLTSTSSPKSSEECDPPDDGYTSSEKVQMRRRSTPSLSWQSDTVSGLGSYHTFLEAHSTTLLSLMMICFIITDNECSYYVTSHRRYVPTKYIATKITIRMVTPLNTHGKRSIVGPTHSFYDHHHILHNSLRCVAQAAR